jgi:hypothetical protein
MTPIRSRQGLEQPHFRGVGELENSSVKLLFIAHRAEIAQR